jgi:hypothetical protein
MTYFSPLQLDLQRVEELFERQKLDSCLILWRFFQFSGTLAKLTLPLEHVKGFGDGSEPIGVLAGAD